MWQVEGPAPPHPALGKQRPGAVGPAPLRLPWREGGGGGGRRGQRCRVCRSHPRRLPWGSPGVPLPAGDALPFPPEPCSLGRAGTRPRLRTLCGTRGGSSGRLSRSGCGRGVAGWQQAPGGCGVSGVPPRSASALGREQRLAEGNLPAAESRGEGQPGSFFLRLGRCHRPCEMFPRVLCTRSAELPRERIPPCSRASSKLLWACFFLKGLGFFFFSII